MKINEKDFILAISVAETIIKAQKDYINELEQKVDDLQKALSNTKSEHLKRDYTKYLKRLRSRLSDGYETQKRHLK